MESDVSVSVLVGLCKVMAQRRGLRPTLFVASGGILFCRKGISC
jgi:hypothetical protein